MLRIASRNQDEHDASSRCEVHPERPAYAHCESCGRAGCISCIDVLASGKVFCTECRARTSSGVIPWEARGELGIATAAWRTIVAVWTRPAVLFSQGPREASIVPAFLFGLAMSWIGKIGSTIADMVFVEARREQLRELPFGRDLLFVTTPEFHLLDLALTPITFAISLAFGALFWWIGLRVMGGARRGFAEIVRALAYTRALTLGLWVVAPLSYLGGLGGLVAIAFLSYALAVEFIAVTRRMDVNVFSGLLALGISLSFFGVLACIGSLAATWTLASHIRLPL